MSTPRERPTLVSPDGVLRRLTVATASSFCAGVIVAQTLPAILVPLPMERLLPPAPVVVARTPVTPSEVHP